jgi:hypothetical protein
VDHLGQLAFGVLQEDQVIHRVPPLSLADSTRYRLPPETGRKLRQVRQRRFCARDDVDARLSR